WCRESCNYYVMPVSNTSAYWSAGSFRKATFQSCSRWAWLASSVRERLFRTSSPSCKNEAERLMLDDLVQRFGRHDRLALSRLVSLIARGEQIENIFTGIGTAAKPVRVVAITGGGGVGKSTLTGKLIEQIRANNQTVAVLACDPQSPLSGGA